MENISLVLPAGKDTLLSANHTVLGELRFVIQSCPLTQPLQRNVKEVDSQEILLVHTLLSSLPPSRSCHQRSKKAKKQKTKNKTELAMLPGDLVIPGKK